MHDFNIIDGFLHCENLRVIDIAEKIQTPFYLYSRRTLEQHFLKLDCAFENIPHILCFSVKSCSNLEILRILKNLGSGADIVSGGELYRTLKAGIDPRKTVYSGVGKTDSEIQYALENNILMFNAESEEEIEVLNLHAGTLRKKAPVAIRVNPDVDPHTHEHITTGKHENKFGIPVDKASELYRRIKSLPNVEILGIDCHIGSQIVTTAPYVEAIETIRKIFINLNEHGIRVKYLNIGGGLGIIYENESPSTALEFRKAIEHLVKDLDVTLIMEPGRFISGNSGILVTRVVFVKETGTKKFIITDAGMNDLVRPCLYGAYHSILPVVETYAPGEKVDVVGPICESADFFARDRIIPHIQRGAVLAIMSAGAYGFSMSSNYNSRPRAAEVLVEGNSFRIIREKENYEDLIRGELF